MMFEIGCILNIQYKFTDSHVLLLRSGICSYIEYYTIQHQHTAEQISIHELGKLASHVLLAVLNSYILFRKEIFIGICEVLQKSYKLGLILVTY